jgi:hypothetical protein
MRAILVAVVLFFAMAGALQAQTFENGGTPGPQTGLGWNYGHLTNCYPVVNNAGQTWFWAFVQEGGFGYTNNPSFVTLLAPACQSGNLIGVFVTSLNPFRWTQVVTFNFQ